MAGYNTFHGHDNGPAPPGLRASPPNPGFGVYGQQPPPYLQAQHYHPAPPVASGPSTQPWQIYQPAPPGIANFQNFYTLQTSYHPRPGINPYQTPPPINGEFPGLNFRNPSGGVGLPPGYDYLFPAQHTVIHVFKPSTTTQPPWQGTTNPYAPDKFIKFFVSTQITVLDLMGRLGLKNSDAKKNVVHEVVEKGNGMWAKGMSINGGDKDRVKMKIADLGWNQDRLGVPGKRPVVWLYITQ